MSTDLHALIRRWKPDKHRARLTARGASGLVSAADIPPARRIALVPDTTVCMHNLAGALPGPAAALLDNALQWHCSVCLAEIATGVANLDPRSPRWMDVRDAYAAMLGAVPDSRVLVPDSETWLAAGVVSGTLARTQDLQRHQRQELLNDALILLTATKAGLPVLTASRGEFDLLQQAAGAGVFICYDTA